jgi:hypothetical protein
VKSELIQARNIATKTSYKMPLNEHDKDLIEAMFRDDCDVNTVLKVVPHAARRTVARMQQNIGLFGQVRKPSLAVKRRGIHRR